MQLGVLWCEQMRVQLPVQLSVQLRHLCSCVICTVARHLQLRHLHLCVQSRCVHTPQLSARSATQLLHLLH